MQRRELFRAGCMNISKNKHVLETIFTPALVPAAAFKFPRIFERAKKHVPNRNVREVVCVMAELMMNPMRFWSLENKTEPRGSFDIPMIEEFPDRDKDCVIASGADAAAE